MTSNELARRPVTRPQFGSSCRNERPALVIAHPGHELRLFGWLCDARPDVFVLTDGSGHSGPPRIESTRRLLEGVGARPGSLFAAYTDQQVYRGLLNGNSSMFVYMATALISSLRRGRYSMVVADPFEGYNPCHDLCSVLSNVAVRYVTSTFGRTIRLFDYALTGHSDLRSSESLITMRLSAEMLRRKRAAAQSYAELLNEVESAVRTEGESAYGEEILRELRLEEFPADALSCPPFYERYGEQQRAAGRYATIIRYADHFLPIAGTLSTLARCSSAGRVQRTAK